MSVDWKAMYEQALRKKGEAFDRAVRAERERDAAVARAEQAEQLIPPHAMLDVWGALGRDSIHFDDWYDEHGYAEAWAELTAAVREGRSDLDAARENAEHYQAMFDATERQRDEWKTRAEQAEQELKPSSSLRQQADSWMRIVNHPAISQALSEKNKSYSDQVFERITWLFEAAEDARESNPAPAVSRADIEKAIGELRTFPRFLTDELLVLQNEAVEAMCDVLGVEAEQTVDPVEEKARELRDVAQPDAGLDWEALSVTAQEQYLRMARHVLGQEATR